jgi:peptidoglycan-N-acetylglucosamine deacetylase
MRNALSIDLEDWFHAELIRSRGIVASPERRVVWAVEPFLTLLQRYQVRATFFVVGDVLYHHPDLVRRIHAEGHEIGCHGWSHRPLWMMAPELLAKELDAFDHDAASLLPVNEIVGFRAPTFSLDARTGWALEVLRAHGYRYDSSIFPVHNYLYGVDDCPTVTYRPTSRDLTHNHAQAELVEFPMSAYNLAGFQTPVSGGFYLRATPLFILQNLLSRINAQDHPFVLYVHPWEADIHTPKPRGLSLFSRFVTYYNAGTVLKKLEVLLQRFEFAPLRDVLDIQGGRTILGGAS